MPSSWPQPAVLENLLQPPSKAAAAEGESGAKQNGSKSSTSTDDAPVYDHRVLALYKFVSPRMPKESLPALKTELDALCRKHSARGTLLIAEEGINGTICYPFREQTTDERVRDDGDDGDELLSLLQEKFGGTLRIRRSVADRPVFARLKIKIKTEIVTMHWQGDKPQCGNSDSDARDSTTASCLGNDDANDGGNGANANTACSMPSTSSCAPCRPTERVGEYVRPRDWNKLLLDPETLVIDTRNTYEIDVGTFRNAVNPHTQSFVEFPDWMKRNIATADETTSKKRALEKPKKIAMFCTGGIRCEKATNAAMQLVPNDVPVYHLQGGILAYLDDVPEAESLFDGDCYVFDQRVAVTYRNRPSTTFRQKCHACRHPLSNVDLEREDYTHGVSCRYCVGKLTEKQEERFKQRQRQMELALEAGRKHIHDPKEERQQEPPSTKRKKPCLR